MDNKDVNSMIQYIYELDKKESHIYKYDIDFLKYRFNVCIEYLNNHDIPIGNMIVYTWLRLSIKDVDNILHGRVKSVSDEVIEFIRYIKNYCAMNREAQALSGNVNPVLSIFHQKAYDGLTDTPQVQVLPLAVPAALNQADILKQFGVNALEGEKIKDF